MSLAIKGKMFTRALATGLLALAAAPASATDLPPGSTLEPVPLAALPSGLTLEANFQREFDIAWTPPFPSLPRHVTGRISQNVYRRNSDNTLIFTYFVHNDDTSQGAITRVSASNFGDFTTDASLLSNLCLNCSNASRAMRDIFGTGVSFEYDLGIPTNFNSRTLIIATNATSYRVSSGRFLILGAGRVSVSAGSHSQSLYGFAYPVVDSTPPVAQITGPSSIEHSCRPVTITGRVYDTAGFDNYRLEYSTTANGPWTLIDEVEHDVNPAGTLAVWDADVPEGYYFLRLTATNSSELSTVVTSVVYVDRAMSPVALRSPAEPNPQPQILGGRVCLDGTVWDNGGSTYQVEYRALPSGAFAHINSGTPTYPGQIITDGLGSWTTNSGPTAVPDGPYQLRITATDGCGNTSVVTRNIVVDNTAPVAVISSPSDCSFSTGLVPIVGTVSDANLAGWSLAYTGGDAHGWVTIASGTGPVNNGVLGTWDARGLRNCAYTLRLHAGDRSSVACGATTNQTDYYVSVNIGCASDFNHDGIVNSADFFEFLNAFFSPCM